MSCHRISAVGQWFLFGIWGIGRYDGIWGIGWFVHSFNRCKVACSCALSCISMFIHSFVKWVGRSFARVVVIQCGRKLTTFSMVIVVAAAKYLKTLVKHPYLENAIFCSCDMKVRL